MSILNRIKAQLNRNDNGATFSNPNPQRGAPAPVARGIMEMVAGGAPRSFVNGRGVQIRPVMNYEDDALVQGPQGLHPMNADVASFSSANVQPNMMPQFEDAYTPDLFLNQTYTQGNPQLTHLGNRVQGTNLKKVNLRLPAIRSSQSYLNQSYLNQSYLNY